ncbi:MAG: glycosyltransferase family 4 protein [Desulfovibrionaceae bacterium]|nr:glycosyltransferase family 4 protein [Desulfovibrionaceae bacterium]
MTREQARIAVMTPRLSRYGGAERFGWDLAEALAGSGYGVDFICARQEVRPPAGVRPVVVGRPGPGRAIKNLWFAWAAERVRRSGAYDLSIGLGRTLRQDILRVGGGPMRVFWRLSALAWPSGPARAWKTLRRALCPANWVIGLLEARQMRSGQVMVAVSHLVRDWMVLAHPHLDPERIMVVYNRPDPGRFAPPDPARREALRQDLGLLPGQTLIGVAGTNFALKGVATLIRALALLPEGFRLHVAGGRNPGRYLDLARDLGLAERVRFMGRVEDMASFYQALDLFVLPTFYDACSNAVLEALSCGLRVVSTRTNGSSFFLPGRWVLDDPGDFRALADIIERTSAEPAPGPFAWPGGAACGLEPYLDLVQGLLEKKGA